MGAIEDGSRSDLYEVKAQTYLGSDEFVEKVPTRSHPEHPLYQISLAEITKAMCQDFGVKVGDLKLRNRARKPAEVRHLVGHLAKELTGLSHVEVAKAFGREAISFSMGVRKISKRMNEDRSFMQKINALSGRLIQGKKRKIY